MERSVSVEDFLGGLLRINKNGMGNRTDSEAAFQEFLKRIPSAQNLAGQQDDRSVGRNSTFIPNASSPYKTSLPLSQSGSNKADFGSFGMPRVPSLDMLRVQQKQVALEASAPGTHQQQQHMQHQTQVGEHGMGGMLQLRSASNHAVEYSQQMAPPMIAGK